MLSILATAVIWTVGALGFHWYRKDYYRRNPHNWNQRGSGLIAFTDDQYWWMMTLWPITALLVVLCVLLWWGCMLIEWLRDLKRN